MSNFFEDTAPDVMEDNFFASHPSYLVAADAHSISNGQRSMLDPENWGGIASSAAQFTLSVGARAVTSAWNTVPEIGSWFGAETESMKLNTEDVLRAMDDDLGQYYVQNKQSVDVVGDILGSIAPGMAGIKVLNWGQRALKMLPEGKAGYNMARSVGMLPDMSAVYARKAAISMAQDAHTFSFVNANTIKSVAAGYGQQALEFGMFEAAAASTMRESPLFQDHDATDIMYNALIGGGVIGGGVMGTIAAVKTYGGIKKALVETNKALNAAGVTIIRGAAERTGPADSIIVLQHDLENVAPILPDDPLAATKMAELTKRNAQINSEIRAQSHKLAVKDAELGNVLADSIRGVDAKTTFQNLAGAVEVSRATVTSEAEKAAAKLGTPATTRWVKLHGENAGEVYDTLPVGLSLADIHPNSEAVMKAVAAHKFSVKTPWDILKATPHEAEARYIFARSVEKLPKDYRIDANDIPMLERALELKVPELTLANGQKLNGGTELINYIERVKNHVVQVKTALPEVELTAGKGITTAELAQIVNTRVSYLEGVVNTKDRVSDIFAMQSNVRDTSARYFERGLTFDTAKQVDTYLMPQYAKVVYDTSVLRRLAQDEVDGLTHIKEIQKVNKSVNDIAAASVLKEDMDLFLPEIPDSVILTADRFGAGPGVTHAAAGGYDTLAASMEYIGKGTQTVSMKAQNVVTERFQSHAYKIKNTPELGTEFAILRQQMLSTPEKYVLKDGRLKLKQIAEWEDEAAEAAETGAKFTKAKPVAGTATAVPDEIAVSDDLAAFLEDWIAHNDEKLTARNTILAARGHQAQDLRGTLYFPQPDPKDYKHWAMVFDPSVSGTGHKSLITAASEAELQQQIKKVPPEFKVKLKAEIEAEKKAQGVWDFDLGINENYVDAALKRSGVAPFFPKMDASSLIDDMIDWRKRMDINLVRDAVALKYETTFKSLQRMGKQATLESTSTFSGASVRKYAESTVQDPYNNYVKTALNISKFSEYKLWKGANELAETAVSNVFGKISGIWQKEASPEKLEEINRALKEAGINRTFEDAATLAYANHTAPKPVLSNFVRGSNSILSTLMLRADPMNALNNGMGAMVLPVAETKSLLDAIAKGNKEVAGRLTEIAKVKIPGTGDSFYSTNKMVASAYGNWFKAVAGGTEEKAFREFYARQGWSTSLHDQMKSIMDDVTLIGNETPAQLSAKLSAASKKTGDFMAKWTGNNFVEEMNRFVASDIARQISDVAVTGKIMTAAEQKVFINSFVNRTQGNYIASQRPIAFQGPLGQSMGLFQTYQFNMLHHIFRRVASGENKNLAVLMGLQGSIYGINGLPGFNAINDHLVGNAAGNISHKDIITTTYDVAGKEGAEWLMYGISSNFLLHPDLKVNMYSRGDINPRQATVIPTTLAELPTVGAAANLFTSIKTASEKIGAGGDVYSSLLQGLEHAGLNRPLAGLATVLQGESTTTKGSLIVSNDLLSLTSLARITGAKPLDEAVARDAMYRVKVYGASRTEQINTIGAAVRSKILAGSVPTPEEINGFMEAYVKAGGDQKNFSKFMSKTMMGAKVSQVNEISMNLKNPFSQYMQTVMGGYQLQDLSNTQPEGE